MIYIIKNKSKNHIWIKTENIIPPEDEGDDIDDYSIIYAFPWDLYQTKAYLRPWIVPGKEYYKIEVIDAIEDIKDLPEPPEVELKRIYQVPEKIARFEEGIRELIKFGLLHSIEFPKGDYSWIIYKDDLISYLYSLWPERYVDLGWEYFELDREDKAAIQKLYSFNTRAQQERFLEELQIEIPGEFILPHLRDLQKILKEDFTEVQPEFINKNMVWSSSRPTEKEIEERLFYEFPIGSVWDKSAVRNKLDEIEKSLCFPENQKIRTVDLWKYFDITRNDHSIKIIRRK